MPLEIERKYLVTGDVFRSQATHKYHIVQGYLSMSPYTIRVRQRDQEAFITIKGKSCPLGLSRNEWEYPIPFDESQELLSLCNDNIIDKERYIVPYDRLIWEVDVFQGRHSGLVLAEVELTHPNQPITLPPWITQEVTGDSRYYNAQLARQHSNKKVIQPL